MATGFLTSVESCELRAMSGLATDLIIALSEKSMGFWLLIPAGLFVGKDFKCGDMTPLTDRL